MEVYSEDVGKRYQFSYLGYLSRSIADADNAVQRYKSTVSTEQQGLPVLDLPRLRQFHHIEEDASGPENKLGAQKTNQQPPRLWHQHQKVYEYPQASR